MSFFPPDPDPSIMEISPPPPPRLPRHVPQHIDLLTPHRSPPAQDSSSPANKTEEGEDDLDGAIPSSQYSEQEEEAGLMIPSTILIRRVMEEQLGVEQRERHDETVMGDDQKEEPMQVESEYMPKDPEGKAIQPSLLSSESPEVPSSSNNSPQRHSDPNSGPISSSQNLFIPPQPPSSPSTDLPPQTVPMSEPGSPGKELTGDRDQENNDIEDDDEFDDPWFDAACLAEVDEIHSGRSSQRGVEGVKEDVVAHQGGRGDATGLGDTGMGGGIGGGGRGGGGFFTAGGNKLPDVSEEAKAKIGAMFKDEIIESHPTPTPSKHADIADDRMDTGFDDLEIAGLDGFGDGFGEMMGGGEMAGFGGFGGGFTTAKGKKLAPPSAAAAARAKKLLDDLEESGPIVDFQIAGSPAELKQQMQKINPSESRSSSFTTAGGSKLAGPSSDAAARIAKLFANDDDVDMDSSRLAPPVTTAPAITSHFTAANGTELAGPSKAASDAVAKLFADEDVEMTSDTGIDGPIGNDTGSDADRGRGMPTPPGRVSMFATAGGNVLSAVSEEAKTRAAALFADDTTPGTPTKQTERFTHPSIKSILPLRDTTNTPRRSMAFKSPVIDQAKPYFRPQATTSRNTASFSTPVKPSPVVGKRVGIGLGMTPRAKGVLATRPKFNSPLKRSGVQPAAMQTPTKPGPSLLGSTTRDRKASAKAVSNNACFDLNTRPPRQDMLAAHLHPGYFSVNELLEMDIPEEIWTVNPENARYYQFMLNDEAIGPEGALKDIKRRGCSRATLPWVTEHWTMILWKLSSLIRAKPELFEEKWTYHEVSRQLLYRYEREMNLAQRSAVKRIQEQDSPPSLPMVLCVSAILAPEPAFDEKGEATPTFPGLELTDGWYRIRAVTDATLGRAVSAGRLQIGYKIAITGARLDASRDGTEVLEAITKSRLIISGNSTSIAAWSTRLGFTNKPFISSLPSLTRDGGAVSLMDIRIKKVFPLAYISGKRGEHISPWTAAEEFKMQDQWKEKYSQEKTRLTQELQSRIALLEDDVARVAGVAEGLMESSEADDTVDGDEELEAFRQALNKTSHLRSLRPTRLLQLYTTLQQEYSSECQQGVVDLEAELQRSCPVRETRNFQVVRFEDSNVYQKERCRTGQLQVWDAHALGEGAIGDGMRFLISNLVPCQTSSWCGPRDQGEIYLSTKRDTVWKRVEEA